MQNFNSIRYGQLISILRNNRPEYRHALCGYKMHDAIVNISKEYNPVNWHKLVLELPKVARDGISIAYYRKQADVNVTATVTKLGKYIKRHFPQLKDNVIRDFVNPYITRGEIITDIDHIVSLMENAENDNSTFPTSCMTKEFSVHPYRVYDPIYGWGLAVKYDCQNNIIGRALVLENENHKCYVRAFTKSSHSVSGFTIDCQLESWLQDQGYNYLTSWPNGARLKKITYRGNIVAPYIDGNRDNCDDYGDFLSICSDGDLECNNTSGFADVKNSHTCEHCGNMCDADETTYIDNYGDVCQNCLDNDFTYVEEVRICGRYIGGEYYLNRYVGQTIEGDNFPFELQGEYDIVELHNGDYTKSDNAVFDADTEEYYHVDDIGTDIVYCEDDNEYHSENYWQCTESDNYYSDNCEYIELDGDKYHPDNVKDKNTLELF